MNYCENCRCAFSGKFCPLCGTNRIREAGRDDFCLICQCDESEGRNICDVLGEAGIRVVSVPYGSGVESRFGLPLSQCRLFVEFSELERTNGLLADMRTVRTDGLKKLVLDNIENLNIAVRLEKKLAKKLKIPPERVLGFCVELIKSCASASFEKSAGATCGYIFFFAKHCTLAIDGDTFEVLSLDVEK